MTRFQQCLKFVLKWEGGYSNHPNDPGGATKYGIIQTVYDAYRKRKGLDRQTVKYITQAEFEEIYKTQYWDAVKGDHRDAPLDIVMFDTGVNMGTGTAERLLSRAKILVAKDDPDRMRKLANLVFVYRWDRYVMLTKRNPRLKVFLKGWLNRMNDLRLWAGLDKPKNWPYK